MASSDVVIILGVLCAAFVIILILVAVFLCLRILKRRRKLKLRDDMERNRLLVDELIGNNNTTGVPPMAESVIVLPAQQEIDGRGNCSDLQAQIACSGVHLQSPGCPTAEEPTGRPSMPFRKADVKCKLHKRKRGSKTCTRDDAPSSNPTTLTDDPYRIRSKSLDTSLHPPSPTSPPLIRVGSWLSLDTESDASSAFSDSISASASPATRSEAEEAVEDTRPGVDPKRRKSGKSNKLSGRIALDYSIYYSSAESTLVLSVKGIKGIPIKYSPSCTSFVRVYLLPKAGGGYLQTCTVRNSLEPIFNDQLQFNKISLQEVWVNSLRFKLYVKGPRGGHHESLAEATRHCVMIIREADEVYEVTESLKLKRSKWMRRSLTVPTLQISEPQPRDNRHPTPMTHSPEGLRDLFVSIQYQPTASRFKVMVRKADHLSKGSHLPGTPPSFAHYVCVNLLRNKEAVIQSETTRSLTGSEPAWNQPFLLHLNRDQDLTDYSIEFVVMRVRFHSSGRVPTGRVVIGPKVEGTGGLHWDEVVRPRLTEVSRWHAIQPMKSTSESMGAMKLRWGICTAGMIANDFLVGLSTLPREEHIVQAIAEARAVQQAKDLAKTHGIAVVYERLEDLAMDPDVDIVYIAAVNQMHLPLCKLFLNHGKHILCEKPLALNENECRQIVDMAKEKGVFFMKGWWSRFFPAAAKLRELITERAIGEVRFMQCAMGFFTDFKDRLKKKEFGGGILLDNGIYPISLALMVFGQRPVSCNGSGFLADSGVDETCMITMLFPNKAAASLSLSMVVALPNEVNIQGTRGHIKIPTPFWAPTKLEVTTQSDVESPFKVKEKTETLEFPLPVSDLPQNYPHAVGMRYEAEAVRQCIKRGRQRVLPCPP